MTMPIWLFWLYALALGGSSGAALALLAAAAFPIDLERRPPVRRAVLGAGLLCVFLFGLLVVEGFAP